MLGKIPELTALYALILSFFRCVQISFTSPLSTVIGLKMHNAGVIIVNVLDQRIHVEVHHHVHKLLMTYFSNY